MSLQPTQRRRPWRIVWKIVGVLLILSIIFTLWWHWPSLRHAANSNTVEALLTGLRWLVLYLTAICATAVAIGMGRVATVAMRAARSGAVDDRPPDTVPAAGATVLVVTANYKRVVLAVFALWIGLGTGYLVLHGRQTRQTNLLRGGPAAHRREQFPTHSHFGRMMYHPYLQGCWRPNSPGVNSHGFLGPEMSLEKPQDSFRVFLLGGSTVADLNIAIDGRLVLANLLEARSGDRVKVFNAATDGHTSQHSLIKYLVTIKDYEPDLIIIWHGINDLSMSLTQYRWGLEWHLDRRDYKSDYSHFYGPMAYVVEEHFGGDEDIWPHRGSLPPRVRPEDLEADGFPSIAAYRRNIESLIAATNADRVQLVLATQPTIYEEQLNNDKPAPAGALAGRKSLDHVGVFGRGMTQINNVTRELADERGIPLVDLASVVPKDRTHFYDECHYTKNGVMLVSQHLADFLHDNDLLCALDANTAQ